MILHKSISPADVLYIYDYYYEQCADKVAPNANDMANQISRLFRFTRVGKKRRWKLIQNTSSVLNARSFIRNAVLRRKATISSQQLTDATTLQGVFVFLCNGVKRDEIWEVKM